MGKLLALELFNFKSYRGHHIMQFGDSYFTSIIGPNGSGKSNSMDAISFVLGIKSSHLRSTHLKDLVYRGRVLKNSKINADGTATDDATSGNASGNSATNGDASEDEVNNEEDESQQSASQRDDPQTAWVMAVYEDDAGEEQRWRRSITGTGQSEYRINNKVVTAKAYNEALEAENILIKARNFLVFQGDVEAIAAQSPKDLTRLIEQISGSLEYKADYERLKAIKDQADEDSNYKTRLRREANGEIKLYQQQKEELDRYEELQDEKDRAVVTHVLWKLFHFQRSIDENTEKIRKHQAELKDFRRNVQKFQDKLEAVKAEQAKVGREVSKAEREIKRREKEVEQKENTLVPIDEKLSIHAGNVKRYQARIEELSKERNDQRKTAEKLRKNLDTVQKAHKRWEDEWRAEQQNAGRELSAQDLQELERLRKEVYKRTGSDQSKIDNITRQLKTDEETVNSLKSKVDSTEALVANLQEEIAGLRNRKSDVKAAIKSTDAEIKQKKVSINALISDRDRTQQKKRELDEKLHQALTKYAEAQGYQRETRKEAEQRRLVGDLRKIYPGVQGQLGNLCRPKQKKYEYAVSTVLGRHYDAVVVDTEKTARECIQYLRDQRMGQATFIPLDTIIHKQPNANLRGMHQGMRLAIDTIDFDTKYERAMSFACGNAIVTDTVAIAKTLVFQRGVDAKAVAVDGTVIHKGGNMTGGEGPGDRKRRFGDDEVENLRTLVDKLRADLDALPKGHKRQAEEERLSSELEGLETKLKYAKDELQALDRNISSREKELQHLESQLKESQPKYEQHLRGVETLRQSLREYTSSVADVEDELFGAFCQRLGYENIREYEKQQGAMQEEARKKDLDFRRHISTLTNQVAYETQRYQSTETRLATVEANIARDRAQLAKLQEEKDGIAAEVAELNQGIADLSAQQEELKKEYDERGERVQEARRELSKRSKGQDQTLKEIRDLDTGIQKATTTRHGVLRMCKVESIKLPLEQGSRKIDSLPLDEEIQEDDGDEDAMDLDDDEGGMQSKVQDYGIRIDYDHLDNDLKQDASDECEESLLNTISNLQQTLEKMAPNMRSADRLEQVEAQLAGTEKEFKASRSAALKAHRDFEAVREKRMDVFNKAFSHISEQIGNVYRELTKTPSFPLGGSASLDVENEEEPYLDGVKYHAMPPLKRFRDMEHLSGGEKTMAALALLFAVHTYAPSPFFVLDEVDAALDHANTMQLAQYVKEHAGPGMQFVVISLKTGLFQNSETLVGIMRDQGINSSRALTLDLRKYQVV